MPGTARIGSVSVFRFISDNTIGALRWEKCRSYCCNHDDEIGRHVGPFPTERHGMEYYACTVEKPDGIL
jgi:hypothetical protein